jgi:hypothetical protein
MNDDHDDDEHRQRRSEIGTAAVVEIVDGTPSVWVPADQSSAETVSSLQAIRKTRMTEAPAAGAISGTMISASRRKKAAPESRAASSSEGSSWWKALTTGFRLTAKKLEK